MDNVADVLAEAHALYARANELYARANLTAGAANSTSNGTSTSASSSHNDRPASFKVIGIALAISSGAFIGTSFVLKKVGLLRANEKYNEVAGEGYGYLKNVFWWSGMTLMIVGEICNFVAYAFTDAILVTPLGALSVVITTILSAIFLKERLSMVGKVACFLCIVGSVVIVMNAPQESSVANIQEMQHFVITPGFLSYAGVILVGSAATAFWAGPRWGKKNMLVYLSICSWVGGLSVVATQGLGSAIVAQAGGTPQFNQWFLYVLLVFVIGTLLTEIIYLNKALNLFNAAMVTPTYYVYFTSTTIITSAVLFQGFKGTVTSIVTVVLGFLTICSGVVLLQLSKSAKDVPDSAVFAGDLDQIHTIAEQEQPESEPKADAIRGAAAIVRRFSTARQNMEVAELKRMHEEKMRERDELEAIGEDGNPVPNNGEPRPPMYEWDGIRRRRTTIGSQRSRSQTVSSRPFTPGAPPGTAGSSTPHPPLGWSHMPTDEELAALEQRSNTPGVLSSIAGTIRGHGLGGRGRSMLLPTYNADARDDEEQAQQMRQQELAPKVQSPMHPVQLTEISVPSQEQRGRSGSGDADRSDRYGRGYGLPSGKTEYVGAAGYASSDAASSIAPPDPPPHSAKRQFSFQNVFRRHQQHGASGASTVDSLPEDDEHDDYDEYGSSSNTGGHGRGYRRAPVTSRGYSAPQVKGSTEEERLGLVKGDSRVAPSTLPTYEEEMEGDDDQYGDTPDYDDYDDTKHPVYVGTATTSTSARYGRGITGSPPSPPKAVAVVGEKRSGTSRGHAAKGSGSGSGSGSQGSGDEHYTRGRGRKPSQGQMGGPQRESPPPPPPPPGGHRYSPPRGGDGAFI
ncbi:hypothetical protein HMPREF1624_05602 [Sporothrix schenckii ATCC 58251]|uniref:Uncharacterized protein n=1 Tax=Sporothrix schenckii (strain ATCC 58251 / de Perez 2211183) TaxID=1391915 RepID=U7PSK6_SPOS1|nr:hypothetical protein HMPREF1624_05602 [Sporothrix schenckii ATCC 58251]